MLKTKYKEVLILINLNKILCPVDLTKNSMDALVFAHNLAGRYRASLTVIHVLENPHMDIPGGETGAFSFGELVDLYREEKEEEIIDVLQHDKALAVNLDIVFKEGVPYDKIAKFARESQTDMIIMLASNETGLEYVLGHTTERVIRLSPCPVLSVHVPSESQNGEKIRSMHEIVEPGEDEKRKILLPTDFSEYSRLAADYAISLAQEYGAEIEVLHVMERVAEFSAMSGSEVPSYGVVTVYYDDLSKSVQKLTDEICTRIDEHDIEVSSRIITGNARHEIVEIAKTEDIDLITIGTHGRKGLSRLIHGSVAEAVVRNAPCSVLSVKKPEHDFVKVD
ncbi:hypothetical protein GF312_00910 [Candidatus Poribacteria bacterium]|nr:hypothetical protein [Candidatus Poribacteria bacterium]